MSNRLEPSRNYDEKLQRILKISAKIFAEKGFGGTILLLYDQRRIALSYSRTLFRYAATALGARRDA